MNEKMNKWLQENPDATPQQAFVAGWFLCTDAWCHGKREKMEEIRKLITEILE